MWANVAAEQRLQKPWLEIQRCDQKSQRHDKSSENGVCTHDRRRKGRNESSDEGKISAQNWRKIEQILYYKIVQTLQNCTHF